jgi:hypothetical protein
MMRRVAKVKMIFYTSRGCESGGPGRAARDSDADSIF